MPLFVHYIDFIWLPIALLTVPRGRRIIAVFFLIATMIMMRLQVELLEFIGYPYGILTLIDWSVFLRASFVYNAFNAGFIIFLCLSKEANTPLVMAAAMSAFFTLLTVSTGVLIL